VTATLDAPVSLTPLTANCQVPGRQNLRLSSGIPMAEFPCWYFRRSQRMIRLQAWASIALNTALDTPWRK
jgi:hypothetical protein